jgi:hypothetical protein
MEKESYSMPTSPRACYEFCSNTYKMCTANATAWNIPSTIIADMKTVYDPYEKDYLVANNRSTQSPAVTAARDASFEPVKTLFTKVYNTYLLNNDLISAADKQALGINIITQGGYAPYPAPNTTPNITLSSEKIAILYIILSDSATPNTHAKPDGVAFCEIRYMISDTAPTSPEACPLNKYIGRSHEAIPFDPSQRGKMIYLYGRWVNRNGKTGPWSGMVIAIIP